MIDFVLRDGMRAGLDYKQIYAIAKDRLSQMMPIFTKNLKSEI